MLYAFIDDLAFYAYLIYELSICSICYAADNWELITKYSRRFLKAGVKLRKSTYEIWMEFASKRGSYMFVLDYFLLSLIPAFVVVLFSNVTRLCSTCLVMCAFLLKNNVYHLHNKIFISFFLGLFF